MSRAKQPQDCRPAVRSSASGRHVVAAKGGWAVKPQARGRAASMHDTQADAIEAAKKAISAKGGTLAVRDGKGRARSSFTVGRDPFVKISAVEGIAPTAEAKARAKQFASGNLSSSERLQAIIDAHRPSRD